MIIESYWNVQFDAKHWNTPKLIFIQNGLFAVQFELCVFGMQTRLNSFPSSTCTDLNTKFSFRYHH